MMTDLEIFDFVAAHLLRQGRRSMNQSGTICAYRGGDGTSCAVGFLIKDEFYDPAMEGAQIVDNPMARSAIVNSIGRRLTKRTREALFELQVVHDRYDIRQWPQVLAETRRDLFPDEPIPA